MKLEALKRKVEEILGKYNEEEILEKARSLKEMFEGKYLEVLNEKEKKNYPVIFSEGDLYVFEGAEDFGILILDEDGEMADVVLVSKYHILADMQDWVVRDMKGGVWAVFTDAVCTLSLNSIRKICYLVSYVPEEVAEVIKKLTGVGEASNLILSVDLKHFILSRGIPYLKKGDFRLEVRSILAEINWKLVYFDELLEIADVKKKEQVVLSGKSAQVIVLNKVYEVLKSYLCPPQERIVLAAAAEGPEKVKKFEKVMVKLVEYKEKVSLFIDILDEVMEKLERGRKYKLVFINKRNNQRDELEFEIDMLPLILDNKGDAQKGEELKVMFALMKAGEVVIDIEEV